MLYENQQNCADIAICYLDIVLSEMLFFLQFDNTQGRYGKYGETGKEGKKGPQGQRGYPGYIRSIVSI